MMQQQQMEPTYDVPRNAMMQQAMHQSQMMGSQIGSQMGYQMGSQMMNSQMMGSQQHLNDPRLFHRQNRK